MLGPVGRLIIQVLYVLAPAAIIFSMYTIRKNARPKRQQLLNALGQPHDRRIVGYFHPYCNAGGGGERVLWTAIAMAQRTEPDVVSVVYSGDTDASKEEIIAKVKLRFDIELDPSSLHFVLLRTRWLVEDATWPAFTLLGQSFGSLVLAWEAMNALVPHLYIDTMGYAFTFPIVKLLTSVPTGAYVHYPTISTQMLNRVTIRQEGVANSSFISRSAVLTAAKLFYYRIIMYYYSQALRTASFKMANSSWTQGHVDAILQHHDSFISFFNSITILGFLFLRVSAKSQTASIVYPPCDTRAMSSFPLDNTRDKIILSVAQFRPEKNHAAQLQAFARLRTLYPADTANLALLGGARNDSDAKRVDALRRLAKELHIADRVQFVVNASYAEVLEWLSKASVGLSTMVDEHFGINVVELMAAGVIPVVHASGGPLNDIVVPFEGYPTGYHAQTPDEFAEAIHTALNMSPDTELQLRTRARTWAVKRFSEDEFEKDWNSSGWRRVLEDGYQTSLRPGLLGFS